MGDIYLRWAFVWQCLGPFLPTEGQITYIQYKCVLTKASVTETNLMGFGSRIYRWSTGHKDSLIVWWAWKLCNLYMLPEFNWTITIWDFLEPSSLKLSSLNYWMICFVCGFFFVWVFFPHLPVSHAFSIVFAIVLWILRCPEIVLVALFFHSLPLLEKKWNSTFIYRTWKFKLRLFFFLVFFVLFFLDSHPDWQLGNSDFCWLFHECIITGIYLANTVYDVLFLTL